MLPHDPSLRFKIRIGIHTGATTAGVVGKNKIKKIVVGVKKSNYANFHSKQF